ncbi:MAG TPA: ATP-binding protein [Stellaceae bacterium]|nr:ATP-binding protein [Stellaceae bacterium]
MASPRVVVVDNSATNLKILARLASMLGDTAFVQTFADPAAALAACARERPDLVVVAGEMTQLDGAAFIARLHSDPGCAEVPAIVVAAFEERDCIDRALAAGAADHLLSPVDHREFRTRVGNLLRLRDYEQVKRRPAIASLEAVPTQPPPAPRQTGNFGREHERLLRVIDAVPALVCATDRDGRYIFCNQRFAAFVGMRTSRLIGRQPLEAHDDQLACSLNDLDHRMLGGDDVPTSFEERIVDREGKRCDLLTTKAVYRGTDGDDAMVVTVSIDITARKHAELDLVAVKEQAEIANRSKTEFLANMSHELRTPLNAIIGFSQVMAGEMLGPIATQRYVGYARDILGSAEHLLGIINDILDVSRLETGKLELVEESIELPKAVADLIHLVESKARAAEVRVVVRREGAVPRLRGDLRKVKQIVLNLLTNAIKFSRPGGEVDIVLKSDGGGVTVAVTDRGIGMDSHEVELAMAHFGRVTGPWIRQHTGTGLGLPLAIGLTELHGGTLTIQSLKGVGTTATVAFPASRSERTEGAAAETTLGGVARQ